MYEEFQWLDQELSDWLNKQTKEVWNAIKCYNPELEYEKLFATLSNRFNAKLIQHEKEFTLNWPYGTIKFTLYKPIKTDAYKVIALFTHLWAKGIDAHLAKSLAVNSVLLEQTKETI